MPHSQQPHVAVWAADPELGERIASTLQRGGYEPAQCAGSLELRSEAPGLDGPRAVVVAPSGPDPAGQITALRARLGDIPIVVVAPGEQEPGSFNLGRPRVEGIVYGPEIEQTLAPSVAAVLTDQVCVPQTMRGALARPVLSHREKQVLGLVLRGFTNGEIATRLYLSESTIKSHVGSSFRKLGVGSRAEAARRLRNSSLTPCSGHPD